MRAALTQLRSYKVQIARAFSSNSLVNTMEMTAVIIYFDCSTIVRFSGLLKKVSNDDTWSCRCIILQKRAGID